jgi:hypothetical protein
MKQHELSSRGALDPEGKPLLDAARFYVIIAYLFTTFLLYGFGLMTLIFHPTLEPLLRVHEALYVGYAISLMYLLLYGGSVLFVVGLFVRPEPSPKHLLRMLMVIALDAIAAASIHDGLAFVLSAGYIQLGAVLLAASSYYATREERRGKLALVFGAPAMLMGALMCALPYVRPAGFSALSESCIKTGCPELSIFDPWIGPALLLQAWFMYRWFASGSQPAEDPERDPYVIH